MAVTFHNSSGDDVWSYDVNCIKFGKNGIACRFVALPELCFNESIFTHAVGTRLQRIQSCEQLCKAVLWHSMALE